MAMRVENVVHHVPRRVEGTWLASLAPWLQTLADAGAHPLRLALVAAREREVVLECTVLHYDRDGPHADALRTIELLHPRCRVAQADPFCVVQIIPTGIRCEFGGFAGDACPVTNLLAGAVDTLITHPNAVNASDLNEMAGNVLYVEGRSLDDFLLGHIALEPTTANRGRESSSLEIRGA